MPARQKLSHLDDPTAVGGRIRRARVAAGLTQQDLATVGCTAAYVSRIEKGKRSPSLQLLREFARVLAVSESFLAHGEGSATTETAVTKLVEARIALQLGELENAEVATDAALVAATSDAERASASALYGEIALYKSDARGAIDALERAVALDRLIEEREPAVADALGRAYARAGEYEAAIGVFLRNYELARDQDDLPNRVRFGALLGYSYSDTGDFAAAESILGELIAASTRMTDPVALARIYWAQSRMHALKKDSTSAARYAERALEVLNLSGQTYYFALAHHLLAHIEIDRGNPTRALELLDNAAPLVAAAGRPFERANMQLERARAMVALGDSAEAATLAMEAAGVLEHANRLDAGRGYSLIAKVFAELGEDERAIELYELAIERLEGIQTRYLVDTLSELADLHEKRGDSTKALALLKRAMNTQAQTGRLLSG